MRTRTGLAALVATGLAAPLLGIAGGGAHAAPQAPLPQRPDSVGSSAAAKQGRPAGAIRAIPGRYVVTLRPGADPGSVARGVGAHARLTYSTVLNGFAADLTDRQAATLRRTPQVLSVEADGVVETQGTEYMDANGQPWGLDRVDQRASFSRSYTWRGTGAGVTAYIIDTGIQTSHADFAGRAVDVYDAYGGNGQDCNGHGTHVAGTVGGARYGVAKGVRLRGVKVLDCTGHGSYSGIIAGIDWVTRNAARPAVANISIGAPYYAPLNQAVTAMVSSGVFTAVAAGNDNADACSSSPSSAAGTMTVASADWYDNKAGTSNWGRCVDLYAPGVNVQSARLGGGQALMSGTSMAAPHVAGMAALVKGDYGDVASATLVSYLASYATTGAIGGNVAGTPNRLLFQAGW